MTRIRQHGEVMRQGERDTERERNRETGYRETERQQCAPTRSCILATMYETTSSSPGDIIPKAFSMTLDHSQRNESARRTHADLPETCPVKTLNPLQKPF